MDFDKYTEKYREILDLPHPTSPTHPRMPISDRAAQFAPFSALTGYDDAIDETARLTDKKIELSDEMKTILDRKQAFLCNVLDQRPEVSVTYFQNDPKKEGGVYKTVTGILKRIDEYEKQLILENGTKISLDRIYNIESKLLQLFSPFDE